MSSSRAAVLPDLSPLELSFGLPKYDRGDSMWHLVIAGDNFAADSVDGVWRLVLKMTPSTILGELRHQSLPSVWRLQQAEVRRARTRSRDEQRRQEEQPTPAGVAAGGFGRGRPIAAQPERRPLVLKRGASPPVQPPVRRHNASTPPPRSSNAPLAVRFPNLDKTLVAQRDTEGQQHVTWRNDRPPPVVNERASGLNASASKGNTPEGPAAQDLQTLQKINRQIREELVCHRATISRLTSERDNQTSRADEVCVLLRQKEKEVEELKKSSEREQTSTQCRLVTTELRGFADRLKEYVQHLEAYIRSCNEESPLQNVILQRHVSRLQNAFFVATQKLNSLKTQDAVEDKPKGDL